MHLFPQVPLRVVTLSALLLIPTLAPPPAQAASDDECGIWLCLPTGFGTGCSGAKSAFKKRIKRFKPPLPDFAACMVKSPVTSNHDNFTNRDGYAAYIPPQKICTEYKRDSMHHEPRCTAWQTRPERYVKGQRCERQSGDKQRTPIGCTGTYRYAEVYRNGSLMGQTHYY
ncbi:hypothetical protein [Vibrio scophthalmi]|uniref:Sex pilus assembly and synthesis protein n=1 Tax=Vibrio scophthalmi LMG 19158 TaxID=870967 RepID=F9RN53_9VIBR|nr:hypothetical protein [Vibrio scophthalmi]EGU37408.1 sex pilus assembly and synthesis protein [Vibrio scophthalmi LMG 19158]